MTAPFSMTIPSVDKGASITAAISAALEEPAPEVCVLVPAVPSGQSRKSYLASYGSHGGCVRG
jgi:predicted phosphoribosyltransferase